MMTTTGQAWRMAGWGGLAALLALPAVAMRFDSGVNWTFFDFVVAAVLLGALGLGVEFAARRSGGVLAKAGMATAVLTSFLLVWINLAVGVIGTENNDASLMFVGVLAVAWGGALLGRFEPVGMARAMLGAAAAHTVVAAIALVFRLGVGDPSWPADVIGTTVMFDALWLAAALLFRRAPAR